MRFRYSTAVWVPPKPSFVDENGTSWIMYLNPDYLQLFVPSSKYYKPRRSLSRREKTRWRRMRPPMTHGTLVPIDSKEAR